MEATCRLCNKSFRVITNTHLQAAHETTVAAYIKKFGSSGVGFLSTVADYAHTDPRYLGWKSSLRFRRSWNSGLTKGQHPGLLKISKTFKQKRIDNFAGWRKLAREQGRIPDTNRPLRKSADLAFLVGMVLGDGNISRFPRTERLTITLGTDKPNLWKRVAKQVEVVFSTKPQVNKVRAAECVRVSLYQKNLSRRLQVPVGARKGLHIKIPEWITSNQSFVVSCLQGLYEAEGSFCVHKNTYTYKMIFVNRNDSLLNFVYNSLVRLGFHPHRSSDKVQVSKKDEVYRLKDLLQFRRYEAA